MDIPKVVYKDNNKVFVEFDVGDKKKITKLVQQVHVILDRG